MHSAPVALAALFLRWLKTISVTCELLPHFLFRLTIALTPRPDRRSDDFPG
jgi:hypothetical protein